LSSSCRRTIGTGFLLLLSFSPSVSTAQDGWSFLPGSTVFKPLIADPREPLTGIVAYLDRTRYEGQIGSAFEVVRYDPGDMTLWSWGFFGSGYILLDQANATFPMQAADWYFGTFFSEKSGSFAFRLEGLHESSHLGDALQGSQVPLFFLPTGPPYSRENVNFTVSFEPGEVARFYAGIGFWDGTPMMDPFFASFGTELYGPNWPIDGLKVGVYSAVSFEWKGDMDVWDKEVQLGLRWSKGADSTRAVRTALVLYSGYTQFGQFWGSFDEYLALATYFDF
jgi:hypothetical protein